MNEIQKSDEKTNGKTPPGRAVRFLAGGAIAAASLALIFCLKSGDVQDQETPQETPALKSVPVPETFRWYP
ncbi:MAG: hypothetical protein CO093_06180 [Alphaproteobacteria bacterium CG_4_9_14_3_um_filter_47_13]|nr:MAG: hypothetical protein CO093_06180 [Alphaproteobacteria bacterium CG_4_9_14_3_um_filter_47_13]